MRHCHPPASSLILRAATCAVAAFVWIALPAHGAAKNKKSQAAPAPSPVPAPAKAPPSTPTAKAKPPVGPAPAKGLAPDAASAKSKAPAVAGPAKGVPAASPPPLNARSLGAKVGYSDPADGPAPMHPASRPPKADRFAPPFEPPPAPGTGPLNFDQVLQLAIYYDPVVLRYVGETEVAIAERRAATDWEDPELRFTYGWEQDVDVAAPYFERESSYTRTGESRFNQQGEFSHNNEFGVNEFQIDSERTRSRETRFRNIERRVVPGATQDTIYETEYENRNTKIRGSRSRRELDANDGDPIQTSRNSRLTENDSRRIVSRTKTVVTHPDVTDSEDQFGILLRVPLPNFFEMNARKARTEAAIHDHNWERKYAEYEVMLKVREEYDKMAIYDALKNSWQKLLVHREKFTDMTKALLPDKLATAADDSAQAAMNVYDASRRAAAARLELARMAGISDPNRIVAPSTLLRRRVDTTNLQVDHLIQMASIYRADLQRVRAQHEAARAEWREYQAKKIPVAAFFDFGWEHHNDREGRDSQELFVRLGVTLPLWSWLFNKEGEIYEAAARGYSRQIGRFHESIHAEVISAVEGVRIANQLMDKFRKRRADIAALSQQSKATAPASDKPQEIVSESEDLDLKLENYELDVIRFYNERVLELERALGTRLETIFDGPGSVNGSK